MIEKLVVLFKQSLLYAIGSFAAPLTAIFMVPIYTRIFAPEDYGVIDLIQITITFTVVFLIMGIDNATGRFYPDPENEQDKKVIASTSLFYLASVLFIGSMLVISFAEEISLLLFDTGIQGQYFMLAISAALLTQCSTLCLNLLKYNFRPIPHTVISVARILVNVSLAILLVVALRWGIAGVFGAVLITSGVFLVISLIFTRRYFSFSFSTGRLKELLVYGIPLVPYGFTVYLIQYCDRYFLLHFSTLDQVGLYGVGARLALLISFLFLGTGAAFGPFLISSYRESDTKLVYRKFVDYSVAVTFLAVVGLSIFPKEILMIFTTSEYLGAYKVVPFLTAYVAFYYLGLLMSYGIQIAKKTKYFTLISIITAAVNIGLNYLLVPLYGMVGAASATLACSVVWCILLVYTSQRYYYVDYNYASYFKVGLVAVSLMLAVYYLLPEVSWQNIPVKIGLMIISLACVYLFGLIGKPELSYLKSQLSRIRRPRLGR